jgi:hypothetical protein
MHNALSLPPLGQIPTSDLQALYHELVRMRSAIEIAARAVVAKRGVEFPTHYAGKLITYRTPYRMPGEVFLVNGTNGIAFPPGQFSYQSDKPFECWGVRFDIVPFEQGQAGVSTNQIAVLATEPRVQAALRKFLRTRIEATSPNENMLKARHTIEDLVHENTQAWEWRDPMTVERGSGWLVDLDSTLPATFTINDVIFDRVRVDVSFFGFLLVVERASETR